MNTNIIPTTATNTAINRVLQNLVTLRHKVTVYVPATCGVATACDNTAQVEATARFLAERFGGATASPAVGYWLSDTVGLVAERTTVVFAFAAEADLLEHAESVVEYCRTLCREMGQEAVALEVDGAMHFVEA